MLSRFISAGVNEQSKAADWKQCSRSDNERVRSRSSLTRCIVCRKVDVVAVNFVLFLRFLPSQLLHLQFGPVGRPVCVVITQTVIVGSIPHVTGMLHSVGGVFGVVIALDVGTFLTVEVRLFWVSVIAVSLMRPHAYNQTDQDAVGASINTTSPLPEALETLGRKRAASLSKHWAPQHGLSYSRPMVFRIFGTHCGLCLRSIQPAILEGVNPFFPTIHFPFFFSIPSRLLPTCPLPPLPPLL